MQQCYVAIKDKKAYVMFSYGMLILDASCREIEDIQERIAYLETQGYIIDTLAHYYGGQMNRTKIIMDDEKEFKNAWQAAVYLNEQKEIKTTVKAAVSYINRVLDGRIKKYLGHTFKKEVEYISVDDIKETIFL